MKIKRVAKIIIFCVIFLVLLNRIYTILSWKDTAGDYYSSVDSFYEVDNGLVDVLFFGSSHCYCSIDPSVLWNEHGIASFSLAISGQDFASTYYTFKEALKTQDPKVVCVDLYGANFHGYGVEGNLYRNTLPFKLSLNSYERIDNMVPEEDEKQAFWFRWPIFHTRYREVKMEDFQTDRPVYLGYCADYTSNPIQDIVVYEGNETLPLHEDNEKWLRKIMELAQESGTELCFIVAPYVATELEQKQLKYVEVLAAERDIPVLSMIKLQDELGIDTKKDFNDWGHTNHYGAQKISNYVGDYLAGHYDLEDHRGDERYALWDENSKVRRHEEQKQQLKLTYNVGGYLDYISCIRDYIVVISTAGNHLSEDADIADSLQTVGVSEEFYGDGGIWIFEDRELVYKTGETNALHHMNLVDGDLLVSRAEGVNAVIVDKVHYQTVEDGINILVYDKVLGEVVDWVGFSAPHAYGIAR